MKRRNKIYKLIEAYNKKIIDSVGIIYENNEEFFNNNFSNNPYGIVSAICYGDYDINDPFVKISEDGSLESLSNENILEECK